ncbi:MAG: hypothetical protein AABY10_05745 [Nanoarchaeota archaeon]
MKSNRYEDQPIRQIEADKAWGLGILLGLFLGPLFYNPQTNMSQPSFQRIDRDNIADLVTTDGKIYLADETEQGMTYRRFTPSDVYRIQ